MTELESATSTAPQPKVKKSLRSKRLMRPGATGGGGGGSNRKPSVTDDVTTPTSATTSPPPPLPTISLKEAKDLSSSPNNSMPSLLTPETTDKDDGTKRVSSDKLGTSADGGDEEEEDRHSATDTETLLATNGTASSVNAAQRPRRSVEDEDLPRKSADNDSKATTTASSLMRRSSEEDNFVEANDGHSMGFADNSPSEPKRKNSETIDSASPHPNDAATPSYSADDSKGGENIDFGSNLNKNNDDEDSESNLNNEDSKEPSAKEERSLLDYFDDSADPASHKPILEAVQESTDHQRDSSNVAVSGEPHNGPESPVDSDEAKNDLMTSPPPVAELESAHSKAVSKSNLGRSTSLRFGSSRMGSKGASDALSPEGRRRPSEIVSPAKKNNRRSIMLTSFVPPVSGNSGSSPSRSSGESNRSEQANEQHSSSGTDANNGVVEITIGGKTFHRSSMLDGQLASNGASSIRLRPSNDVSAPSALAAISPPTQDSTKTALKSIGEKIGVFKDTKADDDGGDMPDWVKEVQRRKREAQERDEAVRAKRNAAKADGSSPSEPTSAAAEPTLDEAAPSSERKPENDDEDVPLAEIDLNDDSNKDDDNSNKGKNALLLSRDKPLPVIEPTASAFVGTVVHSINRPLGSGGPSNLPLVQEKHGNERGAEEQVSSSSLPPNAASARSIYRSLSASLGIGQQQQQQPSQNDNIPRGGSISDRPPATQQHPGPPLPTVHERNRSTSHTNSSSSPASNQGGLFAAVSSFFGRSSTQQSAPPSASALSMPGSRKNSSTSSSPNTGSSRGNRGTIEFPGMRPSNSDARPLPLPQLPPRASSSQAEGKKTNNEMDSLLHQLEAQNQQILKDNKARVFTRETLDEALEDRLEASDSEESKIDWDFWGNLINNYEKTTRAEPRRLAQMIYAGVPKAVRGTVWQVMAGSRNDPALGATFRKLAARKTEPGSEDFKHEKQIRHDLARTFPKLDYFRDTDGAGQEGLYNVLRAYALFDSEVGYCQGLSFIVGPLLLNMPDEEAFGVLVRMMYRYGLRGHFLPSMDDLQLRLYQFEHAFQETLPRLAAHFHAQGVEHTMYVSQWMMTMFAYRLPIQLTFRLFDVVFAEGLDSLLRFAIAVLKRSQTRLLSLDFEAILQYLNEGPLFAFYSHASPDMLVKDANQITAVNGRYLQKLRRGYIEEAQRRMEAEDEGNRMRAENEMLKQENQHLKGSAQKMANAHSEVRAELEKNRSESKKLARLVTELEEKLKLQRRSAEDTVRDELDQLAKKNVQLNVKNQQLEDSLHDMEAALVQIKMLYAESEDQRETMTKKFDDLRRALH
ncbi:GTPase-activating protein [Coemansia sp. RSA 1646]|nr:GTPase-activating protein [Coemansia sp. RSA 1646]